VTYPRLDTARLRVLPLAQRISYTDIQKEAILPETLPAQSVNVAPNIAALAKKIATARKRGASVMLAYGAHLIKNGAGPLLIELIRRGWVTHLATQGAGVIHDWEFAFLGRSSESVRDNTAVGRFGTWDETGRWINLAMIAGCAEDQGLGESVGRLIVDGALNVPSPEALRQLIAKEPSHRLTGARADLLWTLERFSLPHGRIEVSHPFKRFSVLCAAYEHRVPLTVHVGVGYDIIVNHPLFHGGALGRASGADAATFAHGVDGLSDGVYMSVGSAIMSPQVFEKALSAVNNLRELDGRPFVAGHHMTVVDLQDGGNWDWSTGEPPRENPAYYLRYCKTFSRMGGTLEYVQLDNRQFLSALVYALCVAEQGMDDPAMRR
jgi:hypothetical protein